MQEKLTPENTEHIKLTTKINELENRVDLLRQALKRVREDHAEELDKAQSACRAEKNILKKIIVKFREQKEESEHNWQVKLDESIKRERRQLAQRTQIIVALRERLNRIREEHENELAEVVKNVADEKRYFQNIIIHMRAKILDPEKDQQ